MRRAALPLVLATVAYAELGSAEEPRVYGRGELHITELKSATLTPVDSAWYGLVPEGSLRKAIGSVGGAVDLVRWPLGGITSEHARELYWTALVLGGELGIRFSGEVDERRLASLSFVMVPAGLGHAVRCVSRSDCLLLVFQGGPHNRIVPSAAPTGSETTSPEGIPPAILRLSEVSWHDVARGLWRGDLAAPPWARLSVGAHDAAIWRLAPRRSREAGLGGGHSSYQIGLVIEGALLLASRGGGSERLPPLTHFEVPRTSNLTCVSESPCVLLAN